MGRMARRGSAGAQGLGARVGWATACAGLAGALVLVACTPSEEPRPPPQDDPTNVALTVETVEPGVLDDEARATMESEVSDVLAAYVVGGFLGDYPRDDFVDGFTDFSGGATQYAVRDIDALTAAGFEDVTSVSATRLDSRLAFLVDGRRVIGASAWVDFAFAVAAGGTTSTEMLKGRLVLKREDGAWAVFGYEVLRSGAGGSLTAESSP
jgi:hypothetical protein